MKSQAFSRLLPALGLAGLTVLAACKSTEEPSRPRPAPTRTVEKPAPKSSGPSSYVRDGIAYNGRAIPTGVKSTSAIYLEKAVPVEVLLGAPYEYKIMVTNLASYTLEEVVVTEQLGKGFSMKSSNPAASSAAGGNASWALGDLAAGQTKTITITGSANGVTEVANCAEVSYADKVCLTTRFVEPKLKITKQGPAEVLKCDPITYTFVVSNSGTGAARNVKVTDTLPAGLKTESGSNAISFSIPELPGGSQKTFTAKVMATKTGTFSNEATAKADGGLNSTSNAVKTTVRAPNLELAMNAPKVVYGGQNITVNLAVSNTGDAVCKDTMLEASIPSGTSFVSASNGGRKSGSKVQWSLGGVAAKGSSNVSMVLKGDALGTRKIDAKVICYCSDAAAATATTDVKGIPAVLLEVVDVEDPIPVGSDVTYVITVTNQGSLADREIRITCTLEDSMTYVSSSGPTTGSASGRTVTFAPLASLAPKDSKSWKVVIKAKTAGDVRFGVEMNTAELKRKVEETEATNFYE